MTDLTPATGNLLGNGVKDITGTTWLLGHDLKSPTAIIISTLEMVIALHEDDDDMAHTVRLLKGALVAARREYNMVCDLLDLARFELGQYQLDRETADVGALLQQALEEDAYSIEIKKIRVETDIASDEGLITDVDIELLGRVFSTLIDNTIKFTVRDDLLKITAKRIGKMIELLFIDTGRPIFPEFEQSLIERAPQWENRQAGSRSSVGMGIPFANAVIKAHGGIFSAKSDTATGFTTFRITLPVLESD
ncbi:MAG: HAMP domain-containing sensor histidine kinase [Chloroflexota bacterium]